MLTLFPLFSVLYDVVMSMMVKQLGRVSQIPPLYGFIISLNIQVSFIWLQRWSSGLLSLCTGLNSFSYLIHHVSPIIHLFEVLFPNLTPHMDSRASQSFSQSDLNKWITAAFRDALQLLRKMQKCDRSEQGRPEQGSLI